MNNILLKILIQLRDEKVTRSEETADLFTFTEEILNGKLHLYAQNTK